MNTAIVAAALWAFFLWMQYKEVVELRRKLNWEAKNYARLKRYSQWLEEDIGGERAEWLKGVADDEWQDAHRGPGGEGVADMTTPEIPRLGSIKNAYSAAKSRRS